MINMVTAKSFQCPFCVFNVTAADGEEVLKHVRSHRADHHPEKSVSDDDIRRMMRTVEVPQQRA